MKRLYWHCLYSVSNVPTVELPPSHSKLEEQEGWLGRVLLLFIAKQSMSLRIAQAGWSVRHVFGPVTLQGCDLCIWLLRHVVLVESGLKISMLVVSLSSQTRHMYASKVNNIALVLSQVLCRLEERQAMSQSTILP
jgi:hypothetical protein